MSGKFQIELQSAYVVQSMPLRLEKTCSFTRYHLVALLLLFNSFFWYFIGLLVVNELTNAVDMTSSAILSLRLAFPISIMLSALIGAALLSRVRKRRLFYFWLFFGTISSILPIFTIWHSFTGLIAVIVLLGASLGLGMPSLLSFFAESIPVENRGTIGGIMFFMVTMCAPFLIFAMSTLDLTQNVILFTFWRSWSIPILFASKMENNPKIYSEKEATFSSVFNNKTFVLYFLAWLMFSMLDGFEACITSLHMAELGFAVNIVEPIFAGVSALVGGIVADRTGRKRMIIFGFVSLGIAYAVLGIASQLWISWLIYSVIDGIAIGLLWTMFTIVIWGEIARSSAEKFYAVGEAPFFLTQILSLLFAPYVALIPETSAFSLAAFFLFIAVIPLLYAPETLPEKKIQQRQLQIYTQDALELKQRTEQKHHSQQQT